MDELETLEYSGPIPPQDAQEAETLMDAMVAAVGPVSQELIGSMPIHWSTVDADGRYRLDVVAFRKVDSRAKVSELLEILGGAVQVDPAAHVWLFQGPIPVSRL